MEDMGSEFKQPLGDFVALPPPFSIPCSPFSVQQSLRVHQFEAADNVTQVNDYTPPWGPRGLQDPS